MLFNWKKIYWRRIYEYPQLYAFDAASAAVGLASLCSFAVDSFRLIPSIFSR